MASEAVSRFEQMVVAQDETEAYAIAELSLKLGRNPDYIGRPILGAINVFDNEHRDTVAGGPEHGYQLAKNAGRWWMYCTAWLRDQEIAHADQDMPEPETTAQINDYQFLKNENGERLIGSNNYYIFRTYDLLEKERMRLSLEGQEPDDPFELEKEYSLLVLATALGMAVETKDASGPHDNRLYLRINPPIEADVNLTFRRQRTRFSTMYMIELFPPEASDLEAEDKSVAYYELVENRTGITAWMDDPERSGYTPLDPSSALQLAETLAADANLDTDKLFTAVEQTISSRNGPPLSVS